MSAWFNNKFSKPEMTEEEFVFLTSNLSQKDVMIEYGSGYSTPNLAPLVKELWSIEHHPKSFKKVAKMCEEYDNVKHVLIELDEPRVVPDDWRKKPEAKYGYPTPFNCVKSYSTWILSQTQKFDKVLLDGRGRQWVAQFIINNLNPDHEVFVHDYIDRKRYFVIEKFYNKIEVVGCMAKFKCKL